MTTTGDADIGRTLGYLEGRMDEQTALLQQIVAQLEQVNGRIDRVDERIDQVNDRIDTVNDRIDTVGARIDESTKEVNGRIDLVNGRIDESTKEVNASFQRLYLVAFGIGGTIIAGLMGIIGLLATLILVS
jgi:methyl-accepting chemotaxis protein